MIYWGATGRTNRRPSVGDDVKGRASIVLKRLFGHSDDVHRVALDDVDFDWLCIGSFYHTGIISLEQTYTALAQLIDERRKLKGWNTFFVSPNCLYSLILLLCRRYTPMALGTLIWLAIVFLIIAIVAAVLGLGGIAGAAASIVWLLVLVFVVLFVIALIASMFRRPAY